ncbi:SRPBCC family protein [Silvibacterium acidisoli]|uniref:SRPBCC family protein n=1 Tax=Acidobacteriaceae bacterium ZG23-2 TaxID=2883246 RepID=UPI00406C44E2
MSEDTIQRKILLKAPISRVWRAVSDHHEFGEWFRVKIDAPFAAGKPATGYITYPGYEHLRWQVLIQKVEPEHTLSFTWHPYAINPEQDYSAETPTLVEFHLEAIDAGNTLLTVTESGFANIPEGRRLEAFRMNSQGWSVQMENIEAYVGTQR